MAVQNRLIKLKGTIDNITFYKSKYGYIARKKSSLTAERIANDSCFQRTRENGAEFGRAANAGKLLRTSIKGMLQNIADNKMINRLTKQMMKVIHSDLYSLRGDRNVNDGDIGVLEGFDFNSGGHLCSTIYAPFTTTVDRVAGTMITNIPSYIPTLMITAPKGSTHYKIISAGVDIDFNKAVYITDSGSSDHLVWNSIASDSLELINSVTANSINPLLLVLGIEFFQYVNGSFYPLNNAGYNSLCIVKVNRV